MESGWHASDDAEITEEQRWTPRRKLDVTSTYVHMLKRWRQRPWPTAGSEHKCTVGCPWFVERDIVLCARSGNFHICGDVCEHAIVTHEARVCALTQRSVARDMRPDPYDAPAPQRSRNRVRARRGNGITCDARACARRILAKTNTNEHVTRLAQTIQLTWELIQRSTCYAEMKQKYNLQNHSIVIARIMRDGMYVGENNDVCIVPQESFMAESLPSLKVLSQDDASVRAHTRTAKAFRRLLFDVGDADIEQHSRRILNHSSL